MKNLTDYLRIQIPIKGSLGGNVKEITEGIHEYLDSLETETDKRRPQFKTSSLRRISGDANPVVLVPIRLSESGAEFWKLRKEKTNEL